MLLPPEEATKFHSLYMSLIDFACARIGGIDCVIDAESFRRTPTQRKAAANTRALAAPTLTTGLFTLNIADGADNLVWGASMIPAIHDPLRSDGGQNVATLEGVLERITYANEENAWSVVKITVQGKRDPVTVVGNLLGVQPGESLRITCSTLASPEPGRWCS